jgi:hypothetical protein
VTSPSVHRRREQPRHIRTQPPRVLGHGRSRSRRARRRSPWERAASASGAQLAAGLVLVMAASAWLVTFYFVLTFVW